MQRTSVICNRGVYSTGGCHHTIIVENQSRDYDTALERFIELVNNREGEGWALQDLQMSTCIESLATAIMNGTAVGVSDGSYKKEAGTAAWVLESEDGSGWIRGNVVVPGFASDQSVYRSEIAGIYGAVLVSEIVKEAWAINKGGIIIGCDGKEALKQAIDIDTKVTSCKQQQFDLLSGIQGYVRASELQYTSLHIKGHQDLDKSI